MGRLGGGRQDGGCEWGLRGGWTCFGRRNGQHRASEHRRPLLWIPSVLKGAGRGLGLRLRGVTLGEPGEKRRHPPV